MDLNTFLGKHRKTRKKFTFFIDLKKNECKRKHCICEENKNFFHERTPETKDVQAVNTDLRSVYFFKTT